MKRIDERFLQEGEVCILDLSKIKGYDIVNLEEGTVEQDITAPIFLGHTIKSETPDKQYFTIVKHLTNGLLLDMLSGEMIHTHLLSGDETMVTGSEGFRNLPSKEQERINTYCENFANVWETYNKQDFTRSYTSFMSSPLCVYPSDRPFIELDSEMYSIIASQTTAEVIEYIKQKKIMAQKRLSISYSEKSTYIQNVFSFHETYSTLEEQEAYRSNLKR